MELEVGVFREEEDEALADGASAAEDTYVAGNVRPRRFPIPIDELEENVPHFLVGNWVAILSGLVRW